MKITEKLLLDHYDGISAGLVLLSDIPGAGRVCWNYRRGKTGDGYNPVCDDRDDASEITLEYDRCGTIPLDPANADHPAIEKMAHDLAKIYGDEI